MPYKDTLTLVNVMRGTIDDGTATAVERDLPVGGTFRFRVRIGSDEGLYSPFSAASDDVHLTLFSAHANGGPHPSAEPAPPSAAATAGAAAATAGAVAAAVDAALESQLGQLSELGLSREEALVALRESGGVGVSAAADWHFGNPQSPVPHAMPPGVGAAAAGSFGTAHHPPVSLLD